MESYVDCFDTTDLNTFSLKYKKYFRCVICLTEKLRDHNRSKHNEKCEEIFTVYINGHLYLYKWLYKCHLCNFYMYVLNLLHVKVTVANFQNRSLICTRVNVNIIL